MALDNRIFNTESLNSIFRSTFHSLNLNGVDCTTTRLLKLWFIRHVLLQYLEQFFLNTPTMCNKVYNKQRWIIVFCIFYANYYAFSHRVYTTSFALSTIESCNTSKAWQLFFLRLYSGHSTLRLHNWVTEKEIELMKKGVLLFSFERKWVILNFSFRFLYNRGRSDFKWKAIMCHFTWMYLTNCLNTNVVIVAANSSTFCSFSILVK